MFERENVRLLLKPKNMNDGDVKNMISSNISITLGRAKKYAPNVDEKIVDSKEDVDKDIRDAVKMSKDVNYLIKSSTSFCAWF